jgi:hypothetical protein
MKSIDSKIGPEFDLPDVEKSVRREAAVFAQPLVMSGSVAKCSL